MIWNICPQFHLNQAKLRSEIRIKDGRGKIFRNSFIRRNFFDSYLTNKLRNHYSKILIRKDARLTYCDLHANVEFSTQRLFLSYLNIYFFFLKKNLYFGPILDDRLKEKLLKPWKDALCFHFRVCLCVCP